LINKAETPLWQQLYSAISIAFLVPILCWPIIPYIGLEPAWGTSFEKNWLVAASLLLMVFTIADKSLSKHQGWADIILGITWVLFAGYIVIFVLQHPAQAWFLAAALALRGLSVLPILWQQKHLQWWHWRAWFRDTIAAIIMFTWLIYW